MRLCASDASGGMGPNAKMRDVVVNAAGETAASSSSRGRQFAFRRDALMLFVVALDAIHRIPAVPIRLRHEPEHLVRARHRRLQRSWHEDHGLPNNKLVLHGEYPFGDEKNERKRPISATYGDDTAELRAAAGAVDSRLPIV
jgi:hypothetical protein